MDSLNSWLASRKERLVRAAVYEMTDREALRQQALVPMTAFFDSLIQATDPQQQEALQAVLRRWVAATTLADGEPAGLLPVLSAIKRVIWNEFQADPPLEDPLGLAVRLDQVINVGVEYLARIEGEALWEAAQRKLTAATASASDDRVKESFVSVAAHELKTPLTVIEGYANMLRLEFEETPGQRGASMVRGIQTGIERLRQLIDDMIDVSLIEMGLLSLEFQPVWMRRVFDIIEFELNTVVSERRLLLDIQRDSIVGRPTVGDPTRLMQALQKILLNAVKYTPDGGQITVSGRDLDKFMEITVEDTGIGIAPENLERIFEKFSAIGDVTRHSSGKTKFKGGGAGLGLVIARGIIEAHGGTIWAESPGYDEQAFPGSRFHILLPMKDVSAGEGMSPLIAAAMSTVGRQAVELPDSVTLTALVHSPEKAVVQARDRSGEAISDVLIGETSNPVAGEASTEQLSGTGEGEGG
ncbi:MAG TPA: HAMP domain-containing sensor histidine kinase [Aggregatilineaceae bacterium]|nr:HAMP domain-containing sensor histidine kinase [Aggregatilineaceae bacterium]